jgi:hypothetical protein
MAVSNDASGKRDRDCLNYSSAETMAYLDQQAEEFEKLRSELVKTYVGQYVWFESGRVLDADESFEALVVRACQEGESRPLLIKKVLVEDPSPMVRTPFR